MFVIIANWFLSALALTIVSNIVPGVIVESFGSALIAAIILGLVNALVKPALLILTLPLTVVTLGLFAFIINALMLLLVGSLAPGFHVDGWTAAIIGSILLSLITMLFHSLVR